MNPVLLATALAFLQSEEPIDLRPLPKLHATGAVRLLTTETEGARALRPDHEGMYVLADVSGVPGRLARIWLRVKDPRVRLRIYIDDDVVPVLSERVGVAFEEGRRPFSPLATFSPSKSGGAYVVYPNLGFRRMVRVTSSSIPAAFEIHVVEDDPTAFASTEPETPGKSFDLPLAVVAPGATGALGEASDAGTITRLSLFPDALLDDDLRAVRLVVTVDGERTPSIDAPLDLLFAAPSRATRVSTQGLRVSEKELKLELPIPFSRSVRVDLVNGSTRPVRVRGAATVSREPLSDTVGKLRVRARTGEARAGAPFVVGEGEGEGRFLGFTLRCGAKSPDALAGRVTIEADGSPVERSLSIASAFDGGDAFGKAPYSTIGTGVSSAGEAGVMAYCLRLTRLIPFQTAYRASVEVASEAPVPMAAACFVYIGGLRTTSGPSK